MQLLVEYVRIYVFVSFQVFLIYSFIFLVLEAVKFDDCCDFSLSLHHFDFNLYSSSNFMYTY